MNGTVVIGTVAGGPTVRRVLDRAQDYLARHGVEESAASAELLLAHVLGTDRAGLAHGSRALTTHEAKSFGRALCRRCTGTPVQHLTGDVGFRHLVLQVRPRVFIPRPETEVVVEQVLACMRGVARPRVVDVGTGAGAIALSIKDERPDARVVAIDRSPEAVALARVNAQRLGLDVQVLAGALLAAIAVDDADPLDVVVSNPPYIAARDHDGLPDDVKADPYEALVGEPSIYADLALQAGERLRPGGVVVVEIGETLGVQVSAVMHAAGFIDVRVTRDLTGRDRVVTASLPA